MAISVKSNNFDKAIFKTTLISIVVCFWGLAKYKTDLHLLSWLMIILQPILSKLYYILANIQADNH